MKFEHVTQDQFIVNSVVKLITDISSKGRPRDTYIAAVGSGVDELVRQNLRLLSQTRQGFRRGEDLLKAAISKSKQQLDSSLSENRLYFNLSQYLDHAKDYLETPAKELVELNKKLMESKDNNRIPDKSRKNTLDDRYTYEVLELGLLNSIEGLLAVPTGDVKSLNLGTIRESFPTTGEWFPFEVNVNGLLFVIDDDGSIFVDTENLPRDMLDRIKIALHRVADELYN